jgi:hypothetical protein
MAGAIVEVVHFIQTAVWVTGLPKGVDADAGLNLRWVTPRHDSRPREPQVGF